MNTAAAIRQQDVTPELEVYFKDGFLAYSTAKTGIDGMRVAPVVFSAQDDAGNVTGALLVRVFWGQLHIKNLFVSDAARGTGLGRLLMEQAHDYGRQQGCDFAFTETMSFQAEGFYNKLGYRTEYRRDGYEGDTAFIYLQKKLKED